MQSLLQTVENFYGLRLNVAEKVVQGYLSENYILAGEMGEFFLKKYRFQDEHRIREVHNVKQYFFEGGIPVTLPHATKENSTFFFHGGSYYSLFPAVRGKHIAREHLTDCAIASLGDMLGLIHARGKDAPVGVTHAFKPWNREECVRKIEKISAVIQAKARPSLFDALALKTLTLKKRLVDENEVTYYQALPADRHLLHGDYHDANVFFNSGDAVKYVFDFEKTLYGPRSFECIRSIMYCFFTDGWGKDQFRNARHYLAAYRQRYPMHEEEIRSGLRFYYLRSLHTLWIENAHYLDGNNRMDVFLPSEFFRISYLSEHESEFREHLRA